MSDTLRDALRDLERVAKRARRDAARKSQIRLNRPLAVSHSSSETLPLPPTRVRRRIDTLRVRDPCERHP